MSDSIPSNTGLFKLNTKFKPVSRSLGIPYFRDPHHQIYVDMGTPRPQSYVDIGTPNSISTVNMGTPA